MSESPQGGIPERSIPERGVPRRRFGGTVEQIRGALAFYKVLAYATGTMLLLLTAEVILRYAFNLVLAAGGTNTLTGQGHGFGFVTVDSTGTLPLEGAFNISLTVLIVHGWMYVVYLLADFRLWSLMRWNFSKFILIALGGVVPFLSFFVERRIHQQTLAEIESHPKAQRRY